VTIVDPQFPGLTPQNHDITSPPTSIYNCIAWAADDDTRWWWPNVRGVPVGGYYWPPTVPHEPTIEAFLAAYATIGYEPCGGGEFESGYEKVALYVLAGEVTHAARQLADGAWTSKLGNWFDITHESPEHVGGPLYGSVAAYLRRPSALGGGDAP